MRQFKAPFHDLNQKQGLFTYIVTMLKLNDDVINSGLVITNYAKYDSSNRCVLRRRLKVPKKATVWHGSAADSHRTDQRTQTIVFQIRW